MQRMAMVIGLKPERAEEYKQLHANAWPEILERITACNISNYSIYLKEPENLLFGYWEYTGEDFEADAAKMAADPRTQDWWEICKPCQEPLETRADGEWWAMMEEVFHHD
ncbi:MAG: L-rhamnose mutarotase [Rhodobacteraceae bacterium CG17_big_fil_post_rev_8_21_14_2_50_65_11]|nr:MAG: L-rhamnose mutarotase [Rhodobacteraceae bacterium CG17_big_fil_post_rev_8_21_14_2_50_65_11]